MKQYIHALKEVYEKGRFKQGPQASGSYALCGVTMRFKMNEGFPLITVRSLAGSWKALVSELLWVLSGSSDERVLEEKYGVKFWRPWVRPCFELHQQLGFSLTEGELGPVYGHQLRNFGATRNSDGTFQNNGRDQLQAVIDGIGKFPGYRRHVITLYNPKDFNAQNGDELVWICTCHGSFIHFMCFEEEGNKKMDMLHLQRAGDMIVGVPFDIAEYALFFLLVSRVTGYEANEMVYVVSDAHIYENHSEASKEILTRAPKKLPKVSIPDVSELSIETILRLTVDDFVLSDYDSHPAIKDIPVEV